MEAVLKAAGASRIEVSRDEAQRLRFWSGRKNAFPASGSISPGLHVHGLHHSSQAPGGDAAGDPGRWKCKYDLRCVNVFHAGDGNLHPLDPVRRRRRRTRCAAANYSAPIFWKPACGSEGPSRASMASAWRSSTPCACSSRPAERAQFMAVKRAFDPRESLNPGKVIPTLHRCAEYGKMHVHRGHAAVPRAAEILMDRRTRARTLDRSSRLTLARIGAARYSRRRHQAVLWRSAHRRAAGCEGPRGCYLATNPRNWS